MFQQDTSVLTLCRII